VTDNGDGTGGTAGNRSYDGKPFGNCIGSDCQVWLEGAGKRGEPDSEGRCGLIRRRD
jgi:hypothetical protein